jgi:group I intron endonuclease
MIINNTGIYQIKNTTNNKCYIGSALNITKRWREHKHHLIKGNHHSIYLQNAFNKYGVYTFEYSVILYCSKEDLLFYEQRAIDTYKPEYNILKTAGSRLGTKHTEDSKAKMSLAGINRSNESKANIAKAVSYRSPETRKQISNSLTGRLLSDECKSKISLSQKGHIGYNKTSQILEQLIIDSWLTLSISRTELGKLLNTSRQNVSNILERHNLV